MHVPADEVCDAAPGSGASEEPVRLETKIVVVLRDDLRPWQALNVTAFLMSGVATSEPDLIGEPYRDLDGNVHLPMSRQPILVMSASAATLATARTKALSRGIPLALYTADLFATGHDVANRAAVVNVPAADLDLVGIGIRGPRNAVDTVVKGARLHA